MKQILVKLVISLTLLGSAAPAQAVAKLRNKELMRRQALELLQSGSCDKKLEGLRLLKSSDAPPRDVREKTFELISACENPAERASALAVSAWHKPVELTSDEEHILDDLLASDSTLLKGITVVVLARSGNLSQCELKEMIRAADNEEELIFYCGALGSANEYEGCNRIRESFASVLEALLNLPADEILHFKAQLLGDSFPAEVLNAIPNLYEWSPATSASRKDALAATRTAWADSVASSHLASLIDSDSPATPTLLQQIELLRLSTAESRAVLGRALHSRDEGIVRLAIGVTEGLGASASDLADHLVRLIGENDGSLRKDAALALATVSPSRAEELAEKIRLQDTELFLAIERRLLENAIH